MNATISILRILAAGRSSVMLLALLACALLASATVHAAEFPGRTDLECSGSLQASAGDASSPIGSKAVQHGACHGPAAYLAERIGPLPSFFSISAVRRIERMTSLTPRAAAPDLRPPKS